MIKDTDLQAISPAVTHVQSDGTNIGGVDPLDYGYTPIPGGDQSLLLRTSGNSDKTGKGYPAWLWSVRPRPMLTFSGRFYMSYSFAIGGNLAGANVFETDTILIATCNDGKVRKFNLSLQRHVSSGQIDVGDWTDTGIRLGPIAPDVPHKVGIQYAYDLTKNTCAVLSYEFDGAVIVVKNGQQAATESNWSLGAIPQIQLGSMPAAYAWQVKLWDLQYGWL